MRRQVAGWQWSGEGGGWAGGRVGRGQTWDEHGAGTTPPQARPFLIPGRHGHWTSDEGDILRIEHVHGPRDGVGASLRACSRRLLCRSRAVHLAVGELPLISPQAARATYFAGQQLIKLHGGAAVLCRNSRC